MSVCVRYIVDDVDAAIPFYTELLDFKVEMHPVPGFASLSRRDLRLLLNKPGGGSGAGQSMPDGRAPAPGGWLRFQVEVPDIEATAAKLKAAGVALRSEVISGFGGKQVIVDDPSGNPIELFQPTWSVGRVVVGTGVGRSLLARIQKRRARTADPADKKEQR